MKRTAWPAFAICMIATVILLLAGTSRGKKNYDENFARYEREQVELGAINYPLAAHVAYRWAQEASREGDEETAEEYLQKALLWDPRCADAHFTLARKRLLAIDADFFYHLTQGVLSLVREFRYQSLLTVNILITGVLMLMIAASIVALAFLVKYLPYAAHKIQESLTRRAKAAAPRATAYFILLIPLVLFPGFATFFALPVVICWMFMTNRERVVAASLLIPLAIVALCSPLLKPLGPLTDPKSLTMLAARANYTGGSRDLIRAIERTPAKSLEAEKNLALGLLYLKREQFSLAADYFFKANSQKPTAMGYVNLGNTFYLQGRYEKALEGYRKAESIDSTDAVCQYNLAQAYIKTLMLAESSKAFRKASAAGLEKVKSMYAGAAAKDIHVYPKTFSNWHLWSTARTEGQAYEQDVLSDSLLPFTGFPQRTVAWILLGALMAGWILSKAVKPTKRTFQCTNCGKLTCANCCSHDRDTYLCQECARHIDGVSSEKVIDALLRQKRQAGIVKRRKSVRLFTMFLPGIRDIFYGRIGRGFALATIFSISVIEVVTRGLVIKNTLWVHMELPVWKTILPVSGIVITYISSFLSKQSHEFRTRINPFSGTGQKEPRGAVKETKAASG